MKPTQQNKLIVHWLIAVLFLSILLLVMGTWIQMTSDHKIWMLLIFVVVPIIQFLCTPIFTLTGVYTYFSPMVVAFGDTRSLLDLHNGTSYDYLLKMRKIRPGGVWKRTMLVYYLEALLAIIRQMESGELSPKVAVRGSSYFLSERTATRLGFKTGSTSMAEKVNIVLNYLDLVWMYSLSEGRWVWPNLRNIKTVNIQGHDLILQKAYLSELRDYLATRS